MFWFIFFSGKENFLVFAGSFCIVFALRLFSLPRYEARVYLAQKRSHKAWLFFVELSPSELGMSWNLEGFRKKPGSAAVLESR